MGGDKPIPVEILPPVSFIGGPTSQGRARRIQGSWDLEISIAVITKVGIPVEEALDYIEVKTRNGVIIMECDGGAY